MDKPYRFDWLSKGNTLLSEVVYAPSRDEAKVIFKKQTKQDPEKTTVTRLRD